MCQTVQRFGLVCLFVSVCSSVGLASSSAITTGSLFEEMVDMANLARFPEPAFRTVQFSSYDHRSKLPGGPDWFANADGFGGEPIPNFEAVLRAPDANGVGEYLVADVNGPGAIVRLWTAAISGPGTSNGASATDDLLLHVYRVPGGGIRHRIGDRRTGAKET